MKYYKSIDHILGKLMVQEWLMEFFLMMIRFSFAKNDSKPKLLFEKNLQNKELTKYNNFLCECLC